LKGFTRGGLIKENYISDLGSSDFSTSGEYAIARATTRPINDRHRKILITRTWVRFLVFLPVATNQGMKYIIKRNIKPIARTAVGSDWSDERIFVRNAVIYDML